MTLGDFYVAAVEAMEQQDPASAEARLLDDVVDEDAPVLDQPITVGDLDHRRQRRRERGGRLRRSTC